MACCCCYVVAAVATDWDAAAERVRAAAAHTFTGYERHAWGHDELRPVTNGSRDNWGALAVSMVDALDTLLLMQLTPAFERAKEWLVTNLPAKLERDSDVPFFEVTIRCLGGLLGAHTLSPDPALLKLAETLGEKLLRAFDSPSGIPFCTVNLAAGNASCPRSDFGYSIPLAELGSVQLEFGALAAFTERPEFARAADEALRVLLRLPSRDGLYPSRMRPHSGGPAAKEVSFGSGTDSFYETLLKRWLQTGGAEAWLLQMYRDSLRGLQRLLRRSHPSGMLFVAREDFAQQGALPERLRLRSEQTHEHLTCFVPGMLALGAPHGGDELGEAEAWRIARELLSTCLELYRQSPTGLGPERVAFNTAASRDAAQGEARRRAALDQRAARERGERPDAFEVRSAIAISLLGDDTDFEVVDPQWPLRPELLESLYVMWALEPEEARRDEYRQQGLAIFEAIERHCRTPSGYSGLGGASRHSNTLESFFLAETLKYLYLLFRPPEQLPFSLATHVLTTEAHVLPLSPLRPANDTPVHASALLEGAASQQTKLPPWWR